ncbi:MFS transporter [Sabulicella rubraurantiaca]|uniref:MFS transporter n=1 Tax=Sabulicella rubraurantiaca TaxID=2811429 RepID=UPI001A95AA22|nr:MFS transporter [Sabulicella rubraurantiaca]
MSGTSDGSRDHWIALVLIISIRVALTIQVQCVGALGPLLLADPGLGLGYAGLGALIGAYMLPGTLVALPSGWLMARLGERRMVFAGLVFLTVGGLALAAAPGFGTALTTRLVSGAGAALLNVVLSAMVMARFTGPTLAPAMGVFLAANPLGIGIALVTLPILAAVAGSWRVAVLASAAACALALAITPFILAKDRPAPASHVETQPAGGALGEASLRPGEWGPVLASGIAWAALNVGYVILLSFAPALLAGRGASPEAAGALASLAGWASIPLAPLGGALAAWTGRPLLAVVGCLGITVMAVLALAAGVGPQSAALVAAGLAVSVAATVIMTLPARALASESRSFGMGIYWTIFYVGMAGLPPAAGWVADTARGAAAALGTAAAFFGAAILAVAAYGVLMARRNSRAGAG